MDIEGGAAVIIDSWLGVQREQVVHIVTDEDHIAEAEALRDYVVRCGATPKVDVLRSDEIQDGSGIERIGKCMEYVDFIIGGTEYSFITTDEVRNAIRHGARFLSLPLSSNDGSSMLASNFILMSPARAAKMARGPMRALLRSASIRVTTALGTDITFGKKGRRAGLFNGETKRFRPIGSASFEIYVPICETETEGTVVLDGSTGYGGLVREPLPLTFRGGRLTDIADTEDGRRLRAYMESFGDPEIYVAAEFGIGLNLLSRCRGVYYIEDESTYGTFHIGFGRNLALGGAHDAAGHFDIVTHAPDIFADGRCIMQAGEFTL